MVVARTVTVARDGGEFRTIGEALAAVEPGARIFVRAGAYRETLNIDRDCEIVGESGALVEGKGPNAILALGGTRVRLAGLEIRPGGGLGGLFGRLSGNHDLPTVIATGSAVFEDCDVTGAKAGAIGIQYESRVEIRRCRIHDGEGPGVMLAGEEHQVVTIDETEISGVGMPAVDAFGPSAEVEMTGCLIRDSSGIGTWVRSGAQARLVSVELTGLSGPAIRADDPDTFVEIERCRVHDNEDDGILVVSGARAEIHDSQVFANEDEVVIGPGGRASVARCHVHDGRGCGIVCLEGGEVTVEDTTVERATRAGIFVDGAGARITARQNRVLATQGWGIAVAGGAQGLLRENELQDNLFSAFAISGEGTAPEIAENSIHDNGGLAGGLIVQGASPRIHHNTITAGRPWHVRMSAPVIDDEVDRGPTRTPRFPSPDAGRPTIAARVGLGEGPMTMAVGPDGRVWVACVGSSAICRIDPATAGVDLVVDLLHPTDPGLELGPVAVAVGADALWVASAVARSEDDLEAPILERRSLADGSLLGSVELPAGFPLVAHHAFGSVWVAIAGSGALVRVDPDRLAIIGTITMGADANAIADAAGALWVACPESSALLRIDPATDEIRNRLRVPSIGQVASGPHGLWVTTFDSRNEPGSDHGALRRVDPAGNRILDDGGPDWSSDAIAIDESGVWAAPVGRLTRYDPATRQVTADLKVGTMAKRLAVGPGHVWILYPFSIGFMSDEDAPGTLVRVDT